ncbi:GNAT family N-acetyltransferase [Actinocrinis puniceicyclus]|uniref:GNAT family N-acetyltransferase n=1 Tax=Actinocrinis puniceicyclus TaxID=977794 RepID=A0A8J7WLU2_9ACTN|nr:GNAT family protein [Actinocrinis puniceicyclus]MBS2961875.1 GNAT family N-acetyltransferase [Actinocrinis puniceicyclus]
MGDQVRLRPIVEADLPVMSGLYDDPVEASEFGFFGYRNPGTLRRMFEQGFFDDNGGRLAVVRDLAPAEGPGGAESAEVLIGDVGWRSVQTAPNSATWNIGIGLLAAERGKGYGTIAQRLLVRYLFSYTRYHRIEAGTETANLAEQRALEKAGFTREGVARGACFRAGAWRDMVQYSILRPETDLTP